MSFAYSWQASRIPCAYRPLCLHACGFMQKGAYLVPSLTSRLCREILHSSGNTLSGYLYEPNGNNVRASFICVLWKILIYRAVGICKSLCNLTDRFVGVTPWIEVQGLQCDAIVNSSFNKQQHRGALNSDVRLCLWAWNHGGGWAQVWRCTRVCGMMSCCVQSLFLYTVFALFIHIPTCIRLFYNEHTYKKQSRLIDTVLNTCRNGYVRPA